MFVVVMGGKLVTPAMDPHANHRKLRNAYTLIIERNEMQFDELDLHCNRSVHVH